MEKFTITVNENELRNISHGLELLTAKCTEHMKNSPSLDEKAPDLREYYRGKIAELSQQINTYKNIVLNP